MSPKLSLVTAESVSEESLLTAVGEQDREAFALLYDATVGKLYGLALRMLRNEAMAEEVVQETFLTVWEKASAYEASRGKASAWLYTVCHRRCVERIRQEEAGKKRDTLYTVKNASEVSPLPDETMVAREEQAAVQALVKQLSPKQEAVVEEVYFKGKTVKAAAENLQISLPTAKTRLRDALSKLREGVHHGKV